MKTLQYVADVVDFVHRISGRALALALARKGASLSLLDFSEQGGQETLLLVRAEHEKHQLSNAAIFQKCDVSNPSRFSTFPSCSSA